MADLTALGAAEITRRIGTGATTATAVTKACLDRIALRESVVQAWEHLDADGALRRAADLDRAGGAEPLHGVPVGIKDIIDTADMPTRLGTEICRERRPTEDATCVQRLRSAGAVVVGKTVTTEFAYFTPGKTRNPHDPRRTPGGSSSGSAAAVADRMVPIAIATQAAGSTIRPASFCGIWAFKPSYGRWPNRGSLLLYPTLDTLSVYGRCVDDLALVDAVLAAERPEPPPAISRPRIGVFVPPPSHWRLAEDVCRQALEAATRHLADAGAVIEPLAVPAGYEDALAASETVLAYEAAAAISFIPDSERPRISAVMREMLAQGERISNGEYSAAIEEGRTARRAADDALASFDAVLAPGATGEAPVGLGSTGNPIFIRVWNFLHVPASNIPLFVGPAKMPIGVQLIGARNRDEHLLGVLAWVERSLSVPFNL